MPLSKGYVDLQVNGYAGVDFNGDDLQVDRLLYACERLAEDGNAGVLATVITDDLDRMCERIETIGLHRQQHSTIAEMIWGIHIEGPFLNEQPGYIGAHPAHAAQPANIEAMQRLLDSAQGLTRIVTLAPERDPDFRVTKMLADQQVVVSGGHCNPSMDELKQAIDAGLSMFTHLGNGCPLQMHRHDNIVQRVLSVAQHVRIGFIADGVHVPFVALKNYLHCAGIENCFVVTDAVAAAGQGPGTYELAGQTVVVDEQLATWAADRSHLVGSASVMPKVVSNLHDELGFDAGTIEQLTKVNPMRAIGLHE